MNGTARVVRVRGATGGVDPVIKVQLSFVDVPVRIYRTPAMVVSGEIGTFELADLARAKYHRYLHFYWPALLISGPH